MQRLTVPSHECVTRRLAPMEDALEIRQQARGGVEEVLVGAAGPDQVSYVHGRAAQVAKVAARLAADAERRCDVDNALVQPHGGAEVAARRVGELCRDAAEAAQPANDRLGIEGL